MRYPRVRPAHGQAAGQPGKILKKIPQPVIMSAAVFGAEFNE